MLLVLCLSNLNWFLNLVKGIRDDGSGQCYKVQTSAGEVQVSKFDCGCIIHQSIHLPCHHMFAVRKMLSNPLYDVYY